MALINRVSRLFRADFHAVLDHIEEPEVLLKQAIRDMEDELAATEQRVALCKHDQDAIGVRQGELEAAIDETSEQLDLCFNSGKEDLAKSLVRKKLEAGRLLKRIMAKSSANEKFLNQQQKALEENRATLESLRQKAELVAQRTPPRSGDSSEFDDLSLMSREFVVDEDEVEVAFLQEKSKRSAS